MIFVTEELFLVILHIGSVFLLSRKIKKPHPIGRGSLLVILLSQLLMLLQSYR